MKKNKITTIVLAMAVCLMMGACGSSESSSSNTSAGSAAAAEGTWETYTPETSSSETVTETTTVSSKAAEEQTEDTAEQSDDDVQAVSASTSGEKLNITNEVVTEYTYYTSGQVDTSDLFSNRDLTQTPDVSEAVYYTVSDNETVTIDTAGVYVFSGSASNFQIKVEADGENDKVQIVLNGVTVTNESTPVIYVASADKCFVTTIEGTVNDLSVTGTFTADGDTTPDAVIFSKDDLVLNGLGTLNISSSNGNGISGHDDLKITGGTYTVSSALDAIEANDSIRICGGTFNIQTNKDGLHCENDEGDGWIYICAGTFSINAASDGIQATTVLQIDGGEMNITASEGLEATYIQINNGTIEITASDDGINASTKSSYSTPTIEFNGGYTTINMGQGDTDGVDVNGSVYVNGGTVSVNTSGNSFDYDAAAEFNGGTIIINGSEVSEIPQDMMGGGMGGRGGMGGQGDMGNMGGRGMRA